MLRPAKGGSFWRGTRHPDHLSLLRKSHWAVCPSCHSEVADAPKPPPKRLRLSSEGGKPLWRRRERSDELLWSNRLILTRADPSLRSEPAPSWRATLERTRADPSLRSG